MQDRTMHKSRTVELLVAAYAMANIFVAIALFHTDTDTFFRFTQEDGFIEYSTAFFLLASSLVCAVIAFSSKDKKHIAFYALAALAFFFGFGEEISWGQRIFHFGTPEDLMRINTQKEFTVHNIEVYGISFKKILFRFFLNSCVLFYFVGFPILSRSTNRLRKMVKKYNLPVPTTTQARLFLISFFSVFLIDEGKKWELAEMAIASFTFLAILFPSNRKI